MPSFTRLHTQCYNKIDQISLEEVDRLARQPHSVVTSCEMGLNLDCLLSKIWDYLCLLRVYTKKRGGKSPRVVAHPGNRITVLSLPTVSWPNNSV